MSLLVSFLLWLDALPARYWTFVYLSSGLVIFSAFSAAWGPAALKRWNRPSVFAAAVLLALIAYRWPLVFENRQFGNPDESQIIAGAIVLKTDPVFWRSVDGTTHGPLVQYPLAALGAFGIRLDYTNARLVAIGLAWVLLLATWQALRIPFGDGLARVLVLPATLFEITTTFREFNQYTSEAVPLALLALGTWFVASETVGSRSPKPWRLASAGIFLGAVPFAKLQGGPIAAWLVLAGMIFILLERKVTWTLRLQRVAWLAGGTLFVPLVTLAVVIGAGIWPDFWTAYIGANLFYTQVSSPGFQEALVNLYHLTIAADNFREYARGAVLAIAIGLAVRAWLGWRREARFTILVTGLFVTSVYAVVAPNRSFAHYLQFLIAPLTLLLGTVVGAIVRWCEARAATEKRARFHWIGLAAAGLLVTIACRDLRGNYARNEPVNVGVFSTTRGQLIRSPAAWEIRRLTTDRDGVALWGWDPGMFVEAGRAHATREAHTALQLFPSPYQDYYRARYLADFRHSNPAVFVDAIGPGAFYFTDRAKYAHETFPELARIISDRYRLVHQSGSRRIYLRDDRDPESGPNSTSGFH